MLSQLTDDQRHRLLRIAQAIGPRPAALGPEFRVWRSRRAALATYARRLGLTPAETDKLVGPSQIPIGGTPEGLMVGAQA